MAAQPLSRGVQELPGCRPAIEGRESRRDLKSEPATPKEGGQRLGLLCFDKEALIAVARVIDRLDPPTSEACERRFDGSAMSEVRQSPRSAAIQLDIILGNCFSPFDAETKQLSEEQKS
jgi:hypothetical protein